MEEYCYYRKCKKCGYVPIGCNLEDSAYTEYQLGTFNENTQLLTSGFGVQPTEYLLRTCRRCGFKWAEKCLENNDG